MNRSLAITRANVIDDECIERVLARFDQGSVVLRKWACRALFSCQSVPKVDALLEYVAEALSV